jgi:hypothetical protein
MWAGGAWVTEIIFALWSRDIILWKCFRKVLLPLPFHHNRKPVDHNIQKTAYDQTKHCNDCRIKPRVRVKKIHSVSHDHEVIELSLLTPPRCNLNA